MDPENVPEANFYIGLYHDGVISRGVLLMHLINLGVEPHIASETCRYEAIRKANQKHLDNRPLT